MAATGEKHVLVELHKDWADMTDEERDGVVKQLVEGIHGPGTFKPSAKPKADKPADDKAAGTKPAAGSGKSKS